MTAGQLAHALRRAYPEDGPWRVRARRRFFIVRRAGRWQGVLRDASWAEPRNLKILRDALTEPWS